MLLIRIMQDRRDSTPDPTTPTGEMPGGNPDTKHLEAFFESLIKPGGSVSSSPQKS